MDRVRARRREGRPSRDPISFPLPPRRNRRISFVPRQPASLAVARCSGPPPPISTINYVVDTRALAGSATSPRRASPDRLAFIVRSECDREEESPEVCRDAVVVPPRPRVFDRCRSTLRLPLTVGRSRAKYEGGGGGGGVCARGIRARVTCNCGNRRLVVAFGRRSPVESGARLTPANVFD